MHPARVDMLRPLLLLLLSGLGALVSSASVPAGDVPAHTGEFSVRTHTGGFSIIELPLKDIIANVSAYYI